MKKKRKYKTYGLKYKRTSLTPEYLADPKNQEEIKSVMSPPGIEVYLEDIESYAKKILKENGLDENWLSHIGETPADYPDEQSYHARDTLRYASQVRRWLSENNSRMAATQTVNMMHCYMNIVLTEMEPDIYRGRELLKSAHDGGIMKNPDLPKRNREWQKEANAIWSRNPKFSARCVAVRIAAKGLGSFENIRRNIKKPEVTKKMGK
jgi:hypothetical protein